MISPSLLKCPSCSHEVQDDAQQCPNCGWQLRVASSVRNSFTIPLKPREKIPVCVEFGITIDRTGSSNHFARGIRAAVPAILNGVALKATQVSVYLQSHGDLDEGQQMVLLSEAGSIKNACDDVQRIVFEGGGDADEHHLDAIENLATSIPWTADPMRARGVIMAFMTADSKPAKSGRSPEAIGELLTRQGLLTYLICQPGMRQLDRLVKAANGLLIPISNDPSPELMAKVISDVSASIVRTLSTGGTTPL